MNTNPHIKFVYSLLFLIFSNLSFSQTTPWRHVENFETWPQGWGVFNRNNPGPANHSWVKTSGAALGDAPTGTFNSYIMAGVTTDVAIGQNISLWTYTIPFPVTNGDVIKFYTRNNMGTGGDRLQVRLAQTANPYVGTGSVTDVGDFNILLEDINPTNSGSYPDDWTQQTITVSGLPAGEVGMSTIGFRYYLPNVGCHSCPDPDENAIRLDPEEMYYVDLGVGIALEFLPLSEATGAAFSMAWDITKFGIDFASALSGGNDLNASRIGIDNFIYDPIDIKIQNDKGKYFVHEDNPSLPVETLVKDFCANDDVIFDQNVKTIKIHNYGTNLQISNAQITGSDAADFSFYGGSPNGTVSHQPKSIRIKFSPSTPGNKEAIVTFNTNNPSIPVVKFKVKGETINIGTPNLVCWSDVNIKLDANGVADIDNFAFQSFFGKPHPAFFVDLAKYGVCDFTKAQFGVVGGKTYTSSDAGTTDQLVIFADDDRYNSYLTCTTTAHILDEIPPSIPAGYTIPDATYYLHADSSVFYKRDLITPNAGTDNSGTVIGVPEWGSEIIGGHGTYGVNWRFKDPSGNFAFGTYYQTVNIVDQTPPVAQCHGNLNIGFGGSAAKVTALQVNDSSYDISSKQLEIKLWNSTDPVPAIGIDGDIRMVDELSWDCLHEGTTKQVTLVVKDKLTKQQTTCISNIHIASLSTGVCKNAILRVGNNPADQFTNNISLNEVYQGPGNCSQQIVTLSKTQFNCNDLGLDTISINVETPNQTGPPDIFQCAAEVNIIDFETPDYLNYKNHYFDYREKDEVFYPAFFDLDWGSTSIEQPFRLRCSTGQWSYTLTGADGYSFTDTVFGSASALTPTLLPGRYDVKRTMVHPVLKFPNGQPFSVTLNSTITLLDTLPPYPQFTQPDLYMSRSVNNCDELQGIYCPYVFLGANPTTQVYGHWGFVMTGATQGVYTNLELGPQPKYDVALNPGQTIVKSFAVDISGNIADTVYQTYHMSFHGEPEKECDLYQVPAEFQNPYTFTFSDPLKNECGISGGVTWDYNITLPLSSYSFANGSGLLPGDSATVTLNGSNIPISGYYKLTRRYYKDGVIKGVCNATINLLDRTAPTVSCPDTSYIQLNEGVCNTLLEVDNPIIEQNPQLKWYFSLSGPSNYTSSEMLNSVDSATATVIPGTYILTVYGKDVFGNISSCATQVVVKDNTPPASTCPNDVTVSRPSNSCDATLGTCDPHFGGFLASYAPERIEENKIHSTGSVNFTNAPNYLTIYDSNNGSGIPGFTFARIRVACTSLNYNFTWTYTANGNSAEYSQPFYRVTGGEKTLLTGFDPNSTAQTQTGTVSISAVEGGVLDIGLTHANNGISGASLKLELTLAPKLTSLQTAVAISDQCAYKYFTNAKLNVESGEQYFFHKFYDKYGNTKVCNQKITVVDNHPVNATCKNITVLLDKNGKANVEPEELLTSCPSTTNTVSDSTFNCDDIGPNSITVTSTNSLNQSSSCTSTVTISDTSKPFLSKNVLDLTINPAISNPLTTTDLLEIVDDNCAVQSIVATIDSFSCNNFGMNPIKLVATDVNGNISDTLLAFVNVLLDGFSVSDTVGEQQLCTGDTATFVLKGTNVSTFQWQREKTNTKWEKFGNQSIAPSGALMATKFARKRNWQNGNQQYWASFNGNLQKAELYNGELVWTSNISGFFPSTLGGNNIFDIAINHYNYPYLAFAEPWNRNGVSGQNIKIHGPSPSQNNMISERTSIGPFSGSDWYPDKAKMMFPHPDFTQFLVYTAFTKKDNVTPGNNDKITIWVYDIIQQAAGYGTNAWQNFSPPVNTFDYTFEEEYRVGSGNYNVQYPYFVYVEKADNSVSVMNYDYNGGSPKWKPFGNQKFGKSNSTKVSQIDIKKIKGEFYVAYFDQEKGDKVTVRKNNGYLWQPLGIEGFGAPNGDNLELTYNPFDDVIYLTFSTSNPTKTHIFRFINNQWSELTPAFESNIINGSAENAFSTIWFEGEDVLVYAQDSGRGVMKKLELWEDIVGATDDTLSIPNVKKADNGKRVRCVFGTGCDEAISNYGYLFVDSIPNVASITDGKLTTQGPGSVLLKASPSYGNINWFNTDTITSLGSGIEINTPSIHQSEYFFAQAVDGNCSSEKVPVLAEIPYPALDYPLDSSLQLFYDDTICAGSYSEAYFDDYSSYKTFELYKLLPNNQWELDMGPTTYPYLSIYSDSTTTYRFKYFDDYGKNTFNAGGIEYIKDDCPSCDNGQFGFLPESNLNQAVTVEAWVKIKVPSPGGNLSAHQVLNLTSANYNHYTYGPIFWEGGYFSVRQGGSVSSVQFPGIPAQNGWIHIATVADTSGFKVYYNGQLVKTDMYGLFTSSNINPFLNDSANSVKITATQYAEGYDEIKIWNTARTQAQILESMNGCQDPTDSELIFYNNFSTKKYGSYGTRWFEAGKGSSVSVLNDYGYPEGHVTRNSSCEPYLEGIAFSEPFTIHVIDEAVISNSIEYFESENYESCNGEQVVLYAEASFGEVVWYDRFEDGNIIGLGDTLKFFATSDSVVYAAPPSSCPRAEIYVEVYAFPQTFEVTADTVCYGHEFYDADIDVNIDWDVVESYGIYDSDTGGTLIYGDSWEMYYGEYDEEGEGEYGEGEDDEYIFTRTDTFYVEAFSEYCRSPFRIPIIVFVKNNSIINASANTTICEDSSLTIFAKTGYGEVSWWTAEDDFIADGDTLITEVITETTEFYAWSYDDYCGWSDEPHIVTIKAAGDIIEIEKLTSCQTYNWEGNSLSVPGIYHDTLLGFSGCDSIVQLTLILDTAIYSVTNATISCGDYSWSGKTFSQSGTYYDTLQNIDGCDSVIRLNLNYLLEPNIQYLSNVCSSDSVVFSLFNTSPNYSYSLLNNIGTVLEGPKSNDLDDSIQFRTNPISAPSKFNIQVISDTLLNFGTGNSLIFDGNNDRVNCGNDPSVQITGNQITLEAWVYPKQFRNYVHEAHIISKETNSPDYGFMLRTGDNGRINFNAGNGNWNETSTPNSVISLNKWQHVAATYDGVKTRIYVNGLEVYSENRTFTIGNSGNNLTIGGYPNGGGNFNGMIDEVKVWNTARTAAQIQYDMWNAAKGNETGLAAYYDFESASGLTLVDKTGTNNGTLLNMSGTSEWVSGLGENYNNCTAYFSDTLTVNPIPSSSTISVSSCGSYIFGNNTLTQSGTYVDSLLSSQGCDSTVTLNLTILNQTTSTVESVACNSYTWQGKTLTQSGVYHDTLINAKGCDSLLTLNLTINNSNTGTDVIVACNSYTWIDGNTYTTSNNTATHTLQNQYGCDSVITLNLTINNSNTGTDVIVACNSYTWIDGNTYTSSNNTATHTLQNQYGCDSVVTLNLTINNSNTGTDVIVACNSYTWIDGNTYTSSNNTATHTLQNQYGCDSVITLNLTIHNANTGTDVIVACNSYTWIDGNTYTSSNTTATHTLQNQFGCDSVITLNLTINNSNTGTDVIVACNSYTWIDGNTYTSSNTTATHTLQNQYGCDSVVTLNLTIHNANTGTDVILACNSYTWIDGNTYTSSNNTATHTLQNQYGCDSVVTLNLTINNSNTGTDVIVACNSYTWIDGNTYTSSNNTATHTLQNQYGCDSVVTLNLTIHNVTSESFTTNACNSYTWQGKTYTQSGTYHDTITNAKGCDSLMTLNLNIFNSSNIVQHVEACSSYTWINGITYINSVNNVSHTLQTINGCDSIVYLNLTISPVLYGNLELDLCQGRSVSFEGKSYNEDGVYQDTLVSYQGCDSIITITINEFPTPQIKIDTINNPWCNLVSYSISTQDTSLTYLWNTNQTESTIQTELSNGYFQQLSAIATNHFGCQSDTALAFFDASSMIEAYTILANNYIRMKSQNRILNGGMGIRGFDGFLHIDNFSGPQGTNGFLQSKRILARNSTIYDTLVSSQSTANLPTHNTSTVIPKNFTTVYAQVGQTKIENRKNVHVVANKNSTVTLNNNRYGNITVHRGATVIFTQPNVEITNLFLLDAATKSDAATVKFTQSTMLRVKNKVELGKRSEFNPDNMFVTIYIGGGTSAKHFKVSPKAVNSFANVYVEDGDIHIEDLLIPTKTNLTGRFIADSVFSLSQNIFWNWNECLVQINPPAMAQKIATADVTESEKIDETISKEIEGVAIIEIYPNPFKDQFRLKYINLQTDKSQKLSIVITDVAGLKVYEITDQAFDHTFDQIIDLKGLATGMYFINMVNGNTIISEKIMMSK